ncbi:MAG: hypothetical protein Ta2G_17820 [Termitinemataceae bacterium]|nr:MAG: hypothetical protein Ta2G_17820 [Termitinemataceae bacterium]
MGMYKYIVLTIIIFCISFVDLYGDEYVYHDRLLELNIESVLDLPGESKRISGKTVGYGDLPMQESEPWYPKYFLYDELKKGVTILIVTWKKEDFNIIAYLKLVGTEWKVFFSLEYIDGIQF